MPLLDDLGFAELALLGTVLAVAWAAYWFKLRTDAAIGGAEVDRYLFRTDLAEGAAPRNAPEWVIKLVTTRLALVFVLLVGGALIGLLVGVALDDEPITVTFAYLVAFFGLAAAFFLGAPHLEARLPGRGR